MMIPDLQSSLLCDDVRQERNGKFILIGVFDGLSLPKIPFTLPRLCLVNRWCCGEGEFMQKTQILGPDDRQVVMTGRPIPVRLPNEDRVATSIEVFMNIPIVTTGAFWVEISLNRQLKLRYPLHVRMAPTPEPT